MAADYEDARGSRPRRKSRGTWTAGGPLATLAALWEDTGVRQELRSVRWRVILGLVALYLALYVGHTAQTSSSIGGWLSPAPSTASLTPMAVGIEQATAPKVKATAKHKPAAPAAPANSATPIRTSGKNSELELVRSFDVASPIACERENAVFALQQLQLLRAEMGALATGGATAQPPLVVGGIGDSGTRAVAYILTQFGVWMGKFGVTVKKDSRDSKLFINGFPTTGCDDAGAVQRRVVKCFVFYAKSIDHCSAADYNRSCVNDAGIWNTGVQWSSQLFRTLLNHTRAYTLRKSNQEQFSFGLWGFKHPRSAFILPYLSYVTGKRMRYVHIMRDGRDIAAGDNQYFFNSVCKQYHYEGSPLCVDVFVNRVELWARLNVDVLRWASRNLAPEDFMLVRIEDLVLGDAGCYERLARVSRTGDARAAEVIAKSIRLFTVKQERYFGRKYSKDVRGEYERAVKARPASLSAFKAFGYDVDQWGTVGDCATWTIPEHL